MSKPLVLLPHMRNKVMKLYISASDSTIGSMLAQEDDDGVERDIYYLSRVLNDTKTRYNSKEKLCLYLYFSYTKLKYYIKATHFFVYSHFDIIKHMLSKPILHSRIGKLTLALTEYSLTYASLKAMKGKTVVDFIIDHEIVEAPQNHTGFKPWRLYFKGFTHNNGTRVGTLVISPKGIPIKYKFKIQGNCSNNEIEYKALIAGLMILLHLGATKLDIIGDSELVVKQLAKKYKCIKENFLVYFFTTNSLLRGFNSVDI